MSYPVAHYCYLCRAEMWLAVTCCSLCASLVCLGCQKDGPENWPGIYCPPCYEAMERFEHSLKDLRTEITNGD